MHLLLERGSFVMQLPASTACQLWHFVHNVLVLFSQQSRTATLCLCSSHDGHESSARRRIVTTPVTRRVSRIFYFLKNIFRAGLQIHRFFYLSHPGDKWLICSLNLAPFPLRSSPHRAFCSASRRIFTSEISRCSDKCHRYCGHQIILTPGPPQTHCGQCAAVARSVFPSITSFETLLDSVSCIVQYFLLQRTCTSLCL